jgi:aspartokinase-like uncharacterized kinase
MNTCRISVVKVGGSLLTNADLPRLLRRWLVAQQAARHDTHYVLIVGGGPLVDAVREIDRSNQLGDAVGHWICIDLMGITARIVAAALPELALVDQFAELLDRVSRRGVTLFCPNQFLRQIEPKSFGTPLAANWSVTSDSIAGRLAIVLSADELVLIKSAVFPTPTNVSNDPLAEFAASGYVDSFLPNLKQELPMVRFDAFIRLRA